MNEQQFEDRLKELRAKRDAAAALDGEIDSLVAELYQPTPKRRSR